MLPRDTAMLVSYLNSKLRDDDMSLETLVEINDCDVETVLMTLQCAGYMYDSKLKQIKKG